MLKKREKMQEKGLKESDGKKKREKSANGTRGRKPKSKHTKRSSTFTDETVTTVTSSLYNININTCTLQADAEIGSNGIRFNQKSKNLEKKNQIK